MFIESEGEQGWLETETCMWYLYQDSVVYMSNNVYDYLLTEHLQILTNVQQFCIVSEPEETIHANRSKWWLFWCCCSKQYADHDKDHQQWIFLGKLSQA